MKITPDHLRVVGLICARANGVQPLRQVSAIPDGYQKNRSQIWRLGLNRAKAFYSAGLIGFNHRPGIGVFGSGSKRSKTTVWAAPKGRAYVEICKEAARMSNLSWPDKPYGDHDDSGYLTWQKEWLERRDRFRAAMLEIGGPK